MRIALCFYGYARTFPHIRENMKQTFHPEFTKIPHTLDIFINNPEKMFSNMNEDPTNSMEDTKLLTEELLFDTFGSNMKSCKLFTQDVEKYKNIRLDKWRILAGAEGIQNSVCDALDYSKANNIEYDLICVIRLDTDVIRLNFDMVPLDRISFPQFYGYDRSTSNRYYQKSIFNCNNNYFTFIDQIFVGPQRYMFQLQNLLQTGITMCKKNHHEIVLESIIIVTWLRHQIPFQELDFIDYAIYRWNDPYILALTQNYST